LLGKRENLLENLDLMKKDYLKLFILKQLQEDASENDRYELLHELAEHERIIVDNITGVLKYIVPDLVLMRGDALVQEQVSEIDSMQRAVIRKNLGLADGLRERIVETKKRLESLSVLPRRHSYAPPLVVNIRA